MSDDFVDSPAIRSQAAQLLRDEQHRVLSRTDRLFAWLLISQWIVSVVIVLIQTPLTWAGDHAWVHPHVLAALFLGGAIISGPLLMIWRSPGQSLTRHSVAVAQMLVGALFIHLSGGRIEMHFHIFGSLAFLAMYRDPKVLVTASLTVALDHLVRGVWRPETVFGVIDAGPWRVLEHTGWVIFENLFLLVGMHQSRGDVAAACLQRAHALARTAELHRSEEHARGILNTAYDGFIEIDREGLVANWNPRAAEMFGWTREEALGRPVIDLVAPAGGRGRLSRLLARYRRSGRGVALRRNLEFIAQNRTGRTFPAEVAIWSAPGEDRVGLNAFVHDITERKQAEAESARARDAALESARMKSEFLANMSHEIRTPMNGVLGMLSLLVDSPLDVQQRDFATAAHQSAEALLTVLNDILDFSKIEAGKLAFEDRDFDLRDVVEGVLELLAETAQAKGLEIVGVIADGSPTALRGDALRLRQVLLNLAGNAIKFTERGEIVIRASVVEQDGGYTARFEVVDTGIGIAPEVLPRLFQAFSQADGSTTRKYGGTGLGLAISRRLVELMTGDMEVTSELGVGSNFKFHVRFQAAKAAVPVMPRIDMTGRRVLVVDDNATNRTVLHHQLWSWGMRNVPAEDGVQALEALRTAQRAGDPFSIVLLDYWMPGMNGVELARAIKADPELCETRLILLSSLDARLDEAERKEAGLHSVLFKPVRQARLFDCMVQSLAPVTPTAPAAGAPILPKIPLRILLAEDNRVNQKVARAQLRHLGYQCDCVGDGLAAVEANRAQAYDVILMDCQMPKMEGYEAARLIRDDERAAGGVSRVHIIALTAHALEGDRAKCLAAGMDDYVTKPVQIMALSNALARIAARLALTREAFAAA